MGGSLFLPLKSNYRTNYYTLTSRVDSPLSGRCRFPIALEREPCDLAEVPEDRRLTGELACYPGCWVNVVTLHGTVDDLVADTRSV